MSKVGEATRTTRTSKLLVLCVDRDDDLGHKTGVKTPIVGRAACVEAASKLAVADPEEADANSIFAAVREYDGLKEKGYESEVVVIAGLGKRGVEADEKLSYELEKVIDVYRPTGAVLVTDGQEDEEFLPILQSILPVVSIRRVVIKHSRSVEQSYAVLGRYIKMVIFDPRYSKLFLGVPGLLLFSTGLLIFFNLIKEALAVSFAILGLALVMRGFDVDKRVSNLASLKVGSFVRLFSALAALLMISASGYQSFLQISTTTQFTIVALDPATFLTHGPYLVGLFVQEAANFIWIGIGLYFVGSLLVHLLRGSVKVWRNVLELSILAAMYAPVTQFAQILIGKGSTLTLSSLLLFGLAITFMVVAMTYEFARRHRIRMVK